jgi:group II intron reverse transcriptase/maturase
VTTRQMKHKKNQKLRNNEYYNTQAIQDNLYKLSKEGKEFKNLVPLILQRENILLAYRNIKKNKGSKTPGTNSNTIIDMAEKGIETIIEYARNRLEQFTPHKVRRKEIPKLGGGIRPLGIPTIEDRHLQQCIKQVLEPICEAKFYTHSYGFRPNRSAKHAIARCMFLTNRVGLHYAVDIDIKGFFDNVDHNKLLKQLWTLGIKDKELLKLISKILKAEIDGIGIPSKGTPQGGVISPLLSNVVLNELDWWVCNQWEYFETYYRYSDNSNKIRTLKKTNLKEMYIVRYADDFKIFCRNAKTAQKVFVAVKQWLKERLNLDISPEKSKVVNLRKNYSDFLGFKLKVRVKGNKRVAKTHVSDKASARIIKTFKEMIKNIRKNPSSQTVNKLNSKILGWHNYYTIATNVSLDFSEIAFLVKKNLYNGTRSIRSSTNITSKAYKKFYSRYNCKTITIAGITIFPLHGVKLKYAKNFSPETCNYTEEGRNIIHEKLKKDHGEAIKFLMDNSVINETLEYNDNRISLYIGQNGKCGVSGAPLNKSSMVAHRRIPKSKGGKDNYNNLTYVNGYVHELIHEEKEETIERLKNKIKLDSIGLVKINILRKLVGNYVI